MDGTGLEWGHQDSSAGCRGWGKLGASLGQDKKAKAWVGLQDVALKWVGLFPADGCRLGGRFQVDECRDMVAKPQHLPTALPKGCLAG